MPHIKRKEKKIKKYTNEVFYKVIIRYIIITLGAIIAGFALEGFLIPNKIIDGGVIGISIMTSYITKFNLGIILILFNLPFLYHALQKMGKKFILNVLYGVSILALSVNLFHGSAVTHDSLLSTVFGGMILGIGVGLILRNNGALDGTEILALRMSKKIWFSVGEIIMFFNMFIYTAAGFLYGWDSAMYSILTYFITYRVIDVVMEGVNNSKSALIISDKAKDIGDAIIKELDISVTYQKGKGGYSGQEKTLTYCVVSRLEISKMKNLIRSIDPEAFLVIQDVHEVEGIRIKKK